MKVHVRSDRAAALGALKNMASPSPELNLLTREIAIDVAHALYGIAVVSWGHIAGVLNKAADALSRLHAPEPEPLPEALKGKPCAAVAARDRTSWRTASGPLALRTAEAAGKRRGAKRKRP